MKKIEIFVNGEKQIIDENITLADFLNIFEIDLKKVAIEKDLEIINPEEFDSVKLNEGCRVEIVHFIGGG
jgi:sulfur carrier protein